METSQFPESPEASQEHDAITRLRDQFGPPPEGVQPDWLLVHAMDLDAKGVARRDDGKVIFIDGALPYEWVSATSHRKKNNWEAATLTRIHKESPQRARPACRPPHSPAYG